MKFTSALLDELSPRHPLKHPFYQSWNRGELTTDDLRAYACQYYPHVEAFPRAIGATYALCHDPEARKVLLRNLWEEEGEEKSHADLWIQFGQSLGLSPQEMKETVPNAHTRHLMDTLETLSRSSYAEGLGALFAYEQQVPEVAASKIQGLREHYDVTSDQGLEFFKVHLHADVIHSQETAQLMEALPESEKPRAAQAAHQVTDALWGFLDGMEPKSHGAV